MILACKKRNKRSDSKETESMGGFTLIEIMITILILIILVIGAASALSMTGRRVAAQGNARNVTELVGEEMERLEFGDFSTITNSSRAVIRDGVTYTVTTTATPSTVLGRRALVTIDVVYRDEITSVDSLIIEGFSINNW